MEISLGVLIFLVALALAFDFMNGLHDAANSIATVVSTGVLRPHHAVAFAAFFNFVAIFIFHLKVASTVGKGIVDPVIVDHYVIFGALVGAISWNAITWYFGLPSSSSHALIGGIVGAGIASSTQVDWSTMVDKVAIPMVLSPLIGFLGAFALMTAILWIFRRANPHRVARGFRFSQTISAAAMSLGHGLQDAQKTMGVIYMALVTVGWAAADGTIPLWVKLAAATAISLGTYSGGWRIMRTLGRRIIELDPARGFVAESVSALVLYANAFILHAPVSTTHTITSAIMGVGATRRLSAVRWGVAKNIGAAWVLTIPAAALVAAVTTWILHPWLA
jgi:PiT family inorganic phosphate transporter